MRYPVYPEYKDSGVEWLGEIPEGWGCSSLKWFIRTTSGEFISNTEIDSELSEITPVPVIGGNGIMAYSNKINNEPNSIVVGRVGAYCGNVHFIKVHSWVTDNALIITIVGKEYCLDYLYWYLKSLNLNSFANKNAQPLITGEIVKNQTAVIPPFPEQKSIAQFLDKKTSQIDALIEKKNELIEKLKEQRMALITKAVTKGLDDTAPMKDSGVEWLGEIPAGWEVRRLKFLASCNDESLPENTDYNKIIQYVDISSVSLVEGIKKIEEFPFEKAPSRARRIVRNGDTIISTVRTYLKSIATIKEPSDDLIVSTGFAVIRPNEIINSDYISYFLQNQYFIDSVVARSTGVSYPAINAPELTCITIVFPLSIDEQKAIAEYLDEKTAKIDALIEKVEQVIEKLKEYRITLITDAVTGKIKVG